MHFRRVIRIYVCLLVDKNIMTALWIHSEVLCLPQQISMCMIANNFCHTGRIFHAEQLLQHLKDTSCHFKMLEIKPCP